jgi:outer membrane protein
MKKTVILAVIVMFACSSLFSQSIKIGYINSLELVSIMPESKKADSLIMLLASQLDAQYKGYVSEAQNLYAKLQDTTLSEVRVDAIKQDFLYAQKRIQEYEETSSEKINQKKADLYQPILDKATQAVKEVAKENGYTHVIDSSTGAIVYAPEGDNILNLVKKKLGIQ